MFSTLFDIKACTRIRHDVIAYYACREYISKVRNAFKGTTSIFEHYYFAFHIECRSMEVLAIMKCIDFGFYMYV